MNRREVAGNIDFNLIEGGEGEGDSPLRGVGERLSNSGLQKNRQDGNTFISRTALEGL